MLYMGFNCFSSRHKGDASNKIKEMYLITEMYELTENDKLKESSFIQPHASSIQSNTDEKETDSHIEEPAPIPKPSVDG